MPFNKIPGEDNSADLMTKHLAIGTILRHMKKQNLVNIGGRSDAAAKLHLVSESASPVRTTERSAQAIEPTPKKSSNDYWSERGEHGRWLRVHVEPRAGKFDPWRAPRGPERKTRLRPMRRFQGIFDNGNEFDTNDEWQLYADKQDKLPWTGKTILIVDHRHSRDYGTDQMRQGISAQNKLGAVTSCH